MSVGRVLAVDLGRARIGIAVSDGLRLAANPVCVVPSRGDEADLENVARLANEHEAVEIVVGLPLNMDGTESTGSAHARAFALRLAAQTGKPVWLMDERLTSAAAENLLLAEGVRGKKRKARVDKVAAAFILQAFLDRPGEAVPTFASGVGS
ncbi:MAG: Holliday junction resolvase RuvX [Deltaproteobacteria bacterium]|nr:Holliday junction resolvase RuvX [Deltaproteobacteria bacterium]